jgi:phosphatidylserine decarboxylase
MLQTAIFDESPLIFAGTVITFIVLFLVTYHITWLFVLLFVLFVLLVMLLLWFFRYPDLAGFKADEDVLFAPCDGVVKSLDYDPSSGEYKYVLFLNVLDQHHQYYPINGVVIGTKHTNGSFHPAYLLEKSQYNERQLTSMRGEKGERITVTQIAGQVARRIVNNAVPGVVVKQGERMGMIKFSSRVDVAFARAHFVPLVKQGERVWALKSALAKREVKETSAKE